MTGRTALAVIIALALAAPLFAGDVCTMPTGNMVRPGDVDLVGIWWELPKPADSAIVAEAFIGVIDRLELDVVYVDVENMPPASDNSYLEVNAYVELLKETSTRPSLIVGATNILGDDWVEGSQFYGPAFGYRDDPSFFVLGMYNLAVPDGPPSWKQPFIRAELGWGNNFHEDEAFGGVFFAVDPKFGGAILNYRSEPIYVATWQPKKNLQFAAGQLGGDTVYQAGYHLSW